MDSMPYLRPMELRDILDETFDLYKENFALFVTITAVVFLPIQLLIGAATSTNGLQYANSNPSAALQTALARIPAFGLWLLAYYLTVGALTIAISARYLGDSVTPREAYRAILSRFGSFLKTLLLTMFALGGGLIVLALIFGLLALAMSLIHAVVVIVLLACLMPVVFIIGMLFWFSFVFVIPVFALEGKAGFAAIRRSNQLALYRPMKLFGTLGFIGMIIIFIMLILTIPMGIAAGVFGAEMGPSHLLGVLEGAYNGFIQALIQPITLTVIVLLYYDARIRREGFDLEMMANELRSGYSQDEAGEPLAESVENTEPEI